MRFNLIAIDETEYFMDEELKAKIGRIFSVYAYNPMEVTYCCEITPSYFLIPIDTFCTRYPEDDVERERVYDILQEWPSFNEGFYCHCSVIKKIPKKEDGILRKYSGTGFEDEEQALDYFRGNSKLG